MRVLVVSGASGGHIFPAIAFLDTLKERLDEKVKILLVLPKRKNELYLKNISYKIKYLSITPFTFKLNLKNFLSIFNFLKGIFESLFIILEFKPDKIVGFGSLVSIPLVIFGWLFRINTLIHEQNVIPGRANFLLARFTDKIAISFKETKNYFNFSQDKIVLTGNPLRKELLHIEKNKALNFFGLRPDKFTILALGGSQGSHHLNLAFLKAINILFLKYPKLQVIHLCGFRDFDFLKKNYAQLKIDFSLFSFLDAMQYAYSAADLVFSRAGALTISELIFFKLPAIISPYPYAFYHQMANAKVLEKMGAAIIIEDNLLDNDILIRTIEMILNQPDKLKRMQQAYNFFPYLDANNLLVDSLLELS